MILSTELVNLLDSSDDVTVSGGSFPVNIQNGQPKIYYPAGDTADEEIRVEAAVPGEPAEQDVDLGGGGSPGTVGSSSDSANSGEWACQHVQ